MANLFSRSFALLATISVILVACVGAVAPPAAPGAAVGEAAQAPAEVVTVDFWMFPEMTTDTTGELVRTIIAEFEAANPGIKVNLIAKSGGDIVSGLLLGASSQNLPGAVTGQLSNAYPNVLAGAIMDVAPYWNAMPEAWRSQFTPSLVQRLTKEEHIYGIPFTGFATVLFRNRTVLKNAGIDPDAGIKDWADWVEQM
jgi:multiple sugar transport system substrate-binding protein